MEEATDDGTDPRWYHLLPKWWPVGAFLLAAMVSGVEAYGQIADQGRRLDKLEAVAPALDRDLAQIKTHLDDETTRLDRIENKVDDLKGSQ